MGGEERGGEKGGKERAKPALKFWSFNLTVFHVDAHLNNTFLLSQAFKLKTKADPRSSTSASLRARTVHSG